MQRDLRTSAFIPYYDGLRGFGAFIVFQTHMGLSGLVPFSAVPPFQFLYNGAFAVDLFFALSGCVMAILATRSTESYVAISARRYVRLALPAAASCLISALILLAGLYRSQVLAAFNHSDWLRMWFQFRPNLAMALREGMLRIFVHPQSAYNSSLWTMWFELWCSLAIFASIYLLRFRWLCFAAAGLATYYIGIKYMYAPVSFCLGVVTCYLRNWLLPRVERSSLSIRIAVGSVATLATIYGFYLGSYPGFAGDGVLYSWFPPALSSWQWASAFGGSIVVLAIGWSPPFRWLFSLRPMLLLGKISFSFYLLHLPILCSLGAWVYLMSLSKGITFGVTTCAVIGCAILFERYVDRPSIRFSRWVSEAIDNPRKLRLALLQRGGAAQVKQPIASLSE